MVSHREVESEARELRSRAGKVTPFDLPCHHREEIIEAGTVHRLAEEAQPPSLNGLAERGAEGIVLGCTELGLLLGPADADVPVFDSARLHAKRALELALLSGIAARSWTRGHFRARRRASSCSPRPPSLERLDAGLPPTLRYNIILADFRARNV